MALRPYTPADLPDQPKLVEYDLARDDKITLDAGGGFQSIIDNWNGRVASAVDVNNRRTLAVFNGVQGLFKPGTGSNTVADEVLLNDLTGFPSGNEDRFIGFAAVPTDGYVGGYRGNTPHIYCIDSPEPRPRFRIENQVILGSPDADRTIAHWITAQHKNGVSTFRVDGVVVATLTATLETVLDTFGIAGAGPAGNYGLVGYTFYAMAYARALTDDEMWRQDWWVATNKSKRTIPSDNPYSTTAPMVDDGASATVTASSASALASLGAVSAAGLTILGAAALALTAIGSTSTASAPIAAQAQASLGGVVSAGAGGITANGSGAAALQSISASGAGTLPVLAVGATLIGSVTSSANGLLQVAGAVSSTLGPVGTESAARADVRGSALTSLGSIVGSATAGGQSLATASSASALGSISTAATGSVPVVGAGSIALATIASNSGTASAVRGAGAALLGAIVLSSSSSIPIGAIGSANLGGVRADGRGGAIASAIALSTLGGIVGTSSATVGQDTDHQLVGPGWTLFATPRRFVASAIRRSFIVSSTGCKAMLKFPRKYAHEIRHAAVDFAPALGDGEELVGAPIVAVACGDLVVAEQRVEGSSVRFTLSGGTAARSFYQSIEIHCATSGGQVLEEVVSVTMAS